jgi:hypothetical protein
MKFRHKTKRYSLFFLIHLNRKTSRILSLNRIPKRCVLVLNSIRFKSFVVGLAGDLPNNDNNPAANKARNEFILVRTRILVKYYHYSLTAIFVLPILDRLTIRRRFCLSIRICRTIDVCPEFPACNHSIFEPPRCRLRRRRWFCIGRLKAMS